LPPVIGAVTRDGPAAAAGIRPGDRIVAIDGEKITDFLQMPQIISMNGGQNLAIDLEREGHVLTVHAVPHLMRQPNSLGELESSFVIGVSQMKGLAPVHEAYTPFGAFRGACRETWDIISTTLTGIVKMAQGRASADQMRGPLGIGKITKKVAEFGFLPLLNLIAILSVSIGLANLFPIPLLDGGHLLYYGCEAVLGRPLGERAQELGFRFGVVLVVGLLLVSAIHDLAR
jgi:regulator of sigma E protease